MSKLEPERMFVLQTREEKRSTKIFN